MPWLSIIMFIVSFFLAGGSKPENRAKAAAIALGVGAATYGISHYTDWGTENLGAIDGVTMSGSGTDATATTANGVTSGNSSAQTSGSSGFWQTVGGVLANPIVAGAGVAAALGISPSTLALIAFGLGAYFLMKD